MASRNLRNSGRKTRSGNSISGPNYEALLVTQLESPRPKRKAKDPKTKASPKGKTKTIDDDAYDPIEDFSDELSYSAAAKRALVAKRSPNKKTKKSPAVAEAPTKGAAITDYPEDSYLEAAKRVGPTKKIAAEKAAPKKVTNFPVAKSSKSPEAPVANSPTKAAKTAARKPVPTYPNVHKDPEY